MIERTGENGAFNGPRLQSTALQSSDTVNKGSDSKTEGPEEKKKITRGIYKEYKKHREKCFSGFVFDAPVLVQWGTGEPF